MIFDQKNGREYSFGNLDTRIEIIRALPVYNDDGSVGANNYTSLLFRKAKVYEDAQNEKAYASSEISGRMIVAYIRDNVGLEIRLTDRIAYKGQPYDIQTIERVFGRGRFLKITAIDRDSI